MKSMTVPSYFGSFTADVRTMDAFAEEPPEVDTEGVGAFLLLGARPETAEGRLCLALLEQGIHDAQKGITGAREWLFDDDGLMLLGARTCCEAVGFDYDAFVQELRERWARGERIVVGHRKGSNKPRRVIPA